jgi:hypothetical protein
MAMDLSGLIQAGFDILTTTVNATTKKITAQLGSVVGQTTDTDSAEWWQHYGFASRPPKPQAGKQAAQALVIRMGDYDIVFASQDLRGLELYGALDHGEVCLYGAGEDGNAQGRILIKKDGSVSLFTKQGNTSGGTGMLMQLDAANNAVRLLNADGHGIIIDEDGITLTTGAAGLKLGADGSIKLVGTGSTQVDGANIILGSVAVPGVNSVLTGVTGLVGVASTKVFASTA